MATVVLGIAGLAATILFGVEAMPGVRGPIERLRSRYALSKWAARGYGFKDVEKIKQQQSAPAHGPLVFAEWTHRVSVSADGDAEHEITVLAVNATEKPCGYIDIPLYGDPGYLPSACWVKFRMARKRVALVPRAWSASSGVGYLRIEFPTAVNSHEQVAFKWGYSSAGSYTEGKEWFEWHISQPVRIYKLALRFDGVWRALGVKGSVSGSDSAPDQPSATENAIRWKVLEPRPEKKLRIDYVLERR